MVKVIDVTPKMMSTKTITEDVAALEQYSGWLLNRTNQIQMEMEILREQNKKLKEVLKFYAEQRHIITMDRFDVGEQNTLWVEGLVEDGAQARKALEECKHDNV